MGEEISWGQRIFGWQTPASLSELNRQGETNLHNLFGVGEMLKWAQLLVGAYGAFLPLLVFRSSFLERYRKLVSWIVPHYALIPYFFLLFAWRVIHNLLNLTEGFSFAADEYSEIIELVLAIGVFLFLVYQLRQFFIGVKNTGKKS